MNYNFSLSLPRNSCSWGITLANTFRNRSRKIWGLYGTNLQNPSDEICRLHKADPGKLLIQIDQAGAEALIVAWLCRRGNFRLLFDNNIKSHSYVASHIFKKQWRTEKFPNIDYLNLTPIKDLSTNPEWNRFAKEIKFSKNFKRYFIGKKTCHAANYRMKAPTFIMDVLKESGGLIVLTRREGEEYLDTYHRLFPEIKEWHSEIDITLKTKKELRNLFGHPRKFYGEIDEKLQRDATAFIPQSTVGTITNIAFCEFQEYIETNYPDTYGWDTLNNKHDSVLIQVPEDDWQKPAKILKNFIEKELENFRGERFRMKSEVSVGKNWGKYDEEKNPNGLKEVEI